MPNFTYKYGLIDGNYILFRNKSLLKENYYPNAIPKNELLRVTLQSFMKLKRERNFQYGLILWDSSPYFKKEAIKNYKADRYYAEESDIDVLNKEKDALLEESKTATPERVIEIQKRLVEIPKEINDILLEIENFKVTQSVKYEFMNDELVDSGFKSVLKKGYEADDHAYLLSKRISTEYQNGDASSTAILCTADKDWVNFVLPGVTFVSTYYGKTYPEYKTNYESDLKRINEHSMRLFNKPVSMSQYEWGILYELSGASHNNAGVWDHYSKASVEKLDWYESIARLLNKDDTLPEYDIFRRAYEAMNMDTGYAPDKVVVNTTDEVTNEVVTDTTYDFSNMSTTYFDDTSKLHNFKLSDKKYKHGVFYNYCLKNFISINMDSYMEYVKGMECISE